MLVILIRSSKTIHFSWQWKHWCFYTMNYILGWGLMYLTILLVTCWTMQQCFLLIYCVTCLRKTWQSILEWRIRCRSYSYDQWYSADHREYAILFFICTSDDITSVMVVFMHINSDDNTGDGWWHTKRDRMYLQIIIPTILLCCTNHWLYYW